MRVQVNGMTDQVYYLLTDHLGSTAITVDTNNGKVAEIRYKPWGETRYVWGTTPTDYRFTGQREENGIGLYFYQARFYDPSLGRFAQADSIVPGGGQGMDRYAYVNNSPLRYSDPSGNKACSDFDHNGQCIEDTDWEIAKNGGFRFLGSFGFSAYSFADADNPIFKNPEYPKYDVMVPVPGTNYSVPWQFLYGPYGVYMAGTGRFTGNGISMWIQPTYDSQTHLPSGSWEVEGREVVYQKGWFFKDTYEGVPQNLRKKIHRGDAAFSIYKSNPRSDLKPGFSVAYPPTFAYLRGSTIYAEGLGNFQVQNSCPGCSSPINGGSFSFDVFTSSYTEAFLWISLHTNKVYDVFIIERGR